MITTWEKTATVDGLHGEYVLNLDGWVVMRGNKLCAYRVFNTRQAVIEHIEKLTTRKYPTL